MKIGYQKDYMDKKRLSLNLIASIFSYALSIFFSFYLTPYLVNHLGKELYGFYGIANNLVSYIMVISMALNSMAAKYITVELVKGEKVRAKQYFTSIFISNVALSLVLVPILVILTIHLQDFLSISVGHLRQVQFLFAFVFLAMLIRLVSSIYGTATYAANRIDIRSYIEMGKSILRVALYVVIFSLLDASIVHVGFILLVLELFNSIIQISLSKKLLPEMTIDFSYFDIKLVFSTLKVGIWNSVNQLGDLLLSSSGLVLANIWLGEVASGNVSIIQTMPALISGIITAINGVFMPRIAHKYAVSKTSDLLDEVQMSQRVTGAIITPIIILLMVFSYEFYNLWVPGNDIELLQKLSIIDIARMMIIGVNWPVLNLTIVTDKVKFPSIVLIGLGVLNILIVNLLISFTNLGVFAIVLSTLIITILFYGIAIPLYSSFIIKQPWSALYKPICQMIVATTVMLPVTLYIHSLFSIHSWKDFILSGFMAAVVSYTISICVFIGPKFIFKLIPKCYK
ncbi:TPA: oligosaccharide flippase family protein [Streptococcus suis 92-1191]|nr:oligosaccharide flippase family protein [Streptococcus suis 92-1191]